MALADEAPVALASYLVGDVVFARASERGSEPMWPGVVVDARDAPEAVRRECQAERVCVMFLGPSGTRGRERDYAWASADRLAPYSRASELEKQKVAKRLRPIAFREACEEARALVSENGGDARLGADAFGGGGGGRVGRNR